MRAASRTCADALFLRDALLLEGEAHVLGDGQLRVQGVVLEDHRDVAVARAARADTSRSPMRIAPVVERLEPGEHAQRRRLARSRRPDEHEQLAVVRSSGRGASTAGWSVPG